MLKLRNNKKGFTLVELMVVVVIIGILTAIAIPVYSAVTDNAEKNACLGNQRTIDSAIMAYRAENTSVPADIAALVTAGLLAEEPTSKCECTYTVDTDDTSDTYGLCLVTLGEGIEEADGHVLHGIAAAAVEPPAEPEA